MEGDMASDEDTLTAVLDRDQRSFRRVLIAGIVMIVVMLLLGGVLAAQNFAAERRLSKMAEEVAFANANIRDVEKKARFEAHRLRQAADNAAIADSRRTMENRAAFEDIRNLIDASSPAGGAVAASPGLALEAATAYLEGRRLPLVGERTIRSVLTSATSLDAPTADILTAVEQMRRFDKAGAQLRDDADGASALTPELEDAATRLDRAAASPALREAAVLGRARIDYILASANNFDRATCDVMFRRASSIPRSAWSIQLLLNRAECWRKNGDSVNANTEFNAAVRRLAATPASPDQALSGSDADPLVQYQAYHGRGTTRIAVSQDNEHDKLRQAQDDLQKAAALRKLGGQSELEVMGSLENLGLAYLHAGQYREAAANAANVARVRSLGWNEVVRALAAGELKDEATAAAARENLQNYRRTEFNECELKKLVGARQEAALLDLLKVTRGGETAATCTAAASTAGKKN
jgi:hypothetical protein